MNVITFSTNTLPQKYSWNGTFLEIQLLEYVIPPPPTAAAPAHHKKYDFLETERAVRDPLVAKQPNCLCPKDEIKRPKGVPGPSTSSLQ